LQDRHYEPLNGATNGKLDLVQMVLAHAGSVSPVPRHNDPLMTRSQAITEIVEVAQRLSLDELQILLQFTYNVEGQTESGDRRRLERLRARQAEVEKLMAAGNVVEAEKASREP
jgi:hypothetical protein